MKRLGIVNSESTALILGDPAALRHWQGDDNELESGTRFPAAADAASAGVTITLADTAAFLWDTDGAGTIDVYALPDDSLLLVHAWIDDDNESDVDALASLPAAEVQDAGEITVFSGSLAILWSAEEGSCIEQQTDGTYQIIAHAMMTESSGLLLPLPNGTYRCICDSVQSDIGEAVRCHLLPADRQNMRSVL